MKILRLVLVAAGVLVLSASMWAQATPPASPQPATAGEPQGAQSWSGTLIDADCHAKNAGQPCDITDQTSSFGLKTADGKVLKLDPSSASKVREALQGKKGNVRATIKGSMERGAVKVDSVDIE